ncbi:MAG: 5-formyltetrahydrofolate cyclo-ligase [Candidatus Omnitrophica bacterium]|nr:5-formyltetrahydrofolate cyclo-ligase [Candidatus Omnitrophota bacterium]
MFEIDRKKEIRGLCLKLLKKQSPEERIRKSGEIKDKLFSLSEFKRAKMVMFYISKDGEVDTKPMILEALNKGKRVAVPVSVLSENNLCPAEIKDYDKELSEGSYGILEPKPEFMRPVELEEIDLLIVPGVAFDRKANRLGRGKGYYDRFLTRLPAGIPRIGLAFDFQIIEDIPVFQNDQPVSRVLSA